MSGVQGPAGPGGRGRSPQGAGRGLGPSQSRTGALAWLRAALTEGGIAEAAPEARLLLAHALGLEPLALVLGPGEPIGAEGARALGRIAGRRLAGEPVARILGEREFWGLPFAISGATLVPRPDTETVVEAALAQVPDHAAPLRLLDLGTGSGILLVALLHELPRAWGLGLDRSWEALQTARGNAARNGVGPRAAFAASDWGGAVEARFDLVVSNPPYIPSSDLAGLAREVRDHDPRLALDGGADGLDAYRSLLGDAARLLAPSGALVLEIGFDQGGSVPALAGDLGWRHVETRRDLGGHPRAVTLRPGAL